MSEIKKVTLQEIIENPIEEIDVPGFGKVKVRCPTIKDKLDARKDAIKITEGLPAEEMEFENSKILSLKMLIEPTITLDEYLNSNDSKISIILDTVSMWYTLRLKALNSKRSGLIKDFLAQMRDSNQ